MTGSATTRRPEVGAAVTAADLTELRARGRQGFAAQGLPSTKAEPWRYFSTRPISKRPVDAAPAAPAPVSAEDIAPWLLDGVAGTAVFVDGRFEPALSDLQALGQRVRVGGLAAAIEAEPERLGALVGTVASADADGLVAANQAWFADGLFVEVPARAVVEAPILALFYATGGGAAERVRQPRNLVLMGRSSQATVVCRYVGAADDAGLTNAVTELSLADNAALRHVEIEEEAPEALHVGRVVGRQGADSQLRSYVLSLGGKAARTAVRAELAGAGAECVLDGLYVAAGEQRLDHYTEIDHLVGHTTSSEYYAGVMDGGAVGNFQGVVYIREGAVDSRTQQLNRNLLLAPGAQANCKPQLEIDNDDVAATHGTTIGQLDPMALFYLESRGIDRDTARGILTFAFAREALGRLGVASLSEALIPRILAKLDVAVASDDGDDLDLDLEDLS
ncbi:MAG: Fe-S cluster assembly protein SufD [Proteobacteria bacterium]|nr:MAG: Fe-S cluster assembly protein SufD [Pseudomonadota bacterium]